MLKLCPVRMIFGSRIRFGNHILVGTKTKFVAASGAEISIGDDFESKRFCYLGAMAGKNEDRRSCISESECKHHLYG